MTDHGELDRVTGKRTTGHEWDGIKELNTPLPRWWVLTFYATIVWAIGYWVVYPAWPMLWSHTTGILHYSSRAEVAVELANLEKIRGDKMAVLGSASLADIEKDPALLALARARGKTVFGDNCAPCHGSGGAGCGAARSTRSCRRSSSVRVPAMPRPTKAPCLPSARKAC